MARPPTVPRRRRRNGCCCKPARSLNQARSTASDWSPSARPTLGYWAPEWCATLPGAGYVADGNIVVSSVARAQGKLDRLPGFIGELVAKHVDVIITQGYPAALGRQRATRRYPDRRDQFGRSRGYRSGRQPRSSGRQRHRSLGRLPANFRPSVWLSSRRPCRACATWRCCGTPTTSA